MLYTQLLRQKRPCPFCGARQRTFAQKPHAYLTYSIAPYAKYHLLVIPKKHVRDFTDLSAREWRDVRSLLSVGIELLTEKGVRDYTILVRSGNVAGRSVEHLHFHIVPKHRIGDLDHKGRSRRVMSPKAIGALTDELEALLAKGKRR